LTLFVAGLFSFAFNISAQKTDKVKAEKSQIVFKQKDVLQNYIDISSMAKDERKQFFGELSSEEKANLFKLHLALQFVKRPSLNIEQKDLILESISFATPDIYDKTNIEKSRQNADLVGQKAKNIFSKQEFFEIFADFNGEETDVGLLRKYQDISNLSMSKRRDVLEKLSAAEKSNLWKLHFTLHLVKIAQLSNQQMKIIIEAISILTPELYEIPKDDLEWEAKVNRPIQLFSSRAVSVFSKDEIAKIFSNFGGKTNSSKDDTKDNHTELLDARCNCSRQWADCSGLSQCGGLCSVPPGGGSCGFGGLYVCNGICTLY